MRKGGVEITLHGVRLSPARDKQQPQQRQQQQPQQQPQQRKPQQRQQQQPQRQQQHERQQQQGQAPAAPATADAQPMETDGSASKPATRREQKKKERDATRHAELRRRQCREPWARLAWPLRKRYRWAAVQVEWTAWMRHRHSVRLRLKGLFWREWTRPQKGLMIDGPCEVLGHYSYRDVWVYTLVMDLLMHLPELRDEDGSIGVPFFVLGPGGQGKRILTDRHGTETDRPVEDNPSARNPGAGRNAGMKSRGVEVGIPASPGVSHARKRSGRRR